ELFRISLATLRNHLNEYDSGYWSYDDVQGHLASPFYHDLHIQQLTALSMISGDDIFRGFCDCWIGYQNISKNRIKALVSKGIQKLRDPGDVVIIG
ncbi:MAG: D-glucuronyl C5-epimerase family protein, partial [Methanothrix sp.]|nr:D-glucuronyl C5-epimerase family protein [Methanothrix sp.]